MDSPFKKDVQVQLLLEQEKDIRVNWKEPFVWTKDFFCWVKSLFGKATESERSFCSRFAVLLVAIVLMLLSPAVTILIFISYTGHVSPLGRVIRPLVYHASLYCIWIFCYFSVHSILCFDVILVIVLVVAASVFVCFVIAFGLIFVNSTLLSARLIVYLWMGLIASKDYYLQIIAIASVFVYNCWGCLSSVKSRYEILLKQTYEKCEELQEKQPNGRKALTYDDKEVPRISSELFQDVIDEILPRSEVYTNLFIKLAMIALFLCLIFSSILVYGESSLDGSTKAIAFILTGLLPKFFEVFGEGSSAQELRKVENASRVKKIVRDFLSKTDGETSMSDEELEPPWNRPGNQSCTTSINEGDQTTLE